MWNKALGDFWSTLTSPYVSQGNIRQFKQRIWQSIRKHLWFFLLTPSFEFMERNDRSWSLLVVQTAIIHYMSALLILRCKWCFIFFFNPVFLQLMMVQSLMLVSVNLFTMLQRDFRRLCLRKICYDPLLNGLH